MQHFAKTTFALFVVLLASFTSAQTLPTFSHIIIVVQENRTPDNIFGYWATTPCTGNGGGFSGADLVNAGSGGPPCNLQQAMNNGGGTTGFDPGHEFEDWTSDCDYQNGACQMDGFCHQYTSAQCDGTNGAPTPYSYIQTSDVEPYYKIATTYGFANYMFQTNEGPSMVAHQFLFTGTSAPVAPDPVGDPNGYWWDFVRDNPSSPDGSGCTSQLVAGWIQPDRTVPLNQPSGYECYTHDSLMTGSSCDVNGITGNCDKYPNLTWTYYSPIDGTTAGPAYIWDAPEAIPEVCYGMNSANNGAPCGGYEWSNHMTFYTGTNGAIVPIFTDITNCKLANISWVIPDLAWSDHPSYDAKVSPALGPSWVADIVNAVGESYSNSNQKCDYWGTSGASGNVVQPTAIFVVWDDWGGFYDHIQPYAYNTGSYNKQLQEWECGAPNSWGCGYTYGFRVPLLVVSEFTGTNTNGVISGYISGACGTAQTGSCPNKTQIYQHDFGSILAFTENNFGLNPQFIAEPYYADYNAPDWGLDRKNVPLSDFFALYTGTGSTGRPFQQIQSSYGASFFQSYYANGGTPAGPDTD